jgi:hypothetical protein
MPKLYLSGKLTCEISGLEDQVKDIMSDVDSGWASLNIEYHEDEIDKIFEVRLSGRLDGTFNFTSSSPTSIEVILDGVAEASVSGSAVIALMGKKLSWRATGISGGYRGMAIPLEVMQDGLTLSKKRPK